MKWKSLVRKSFVGKVLEIGQKVPLFEWVLEIFPVGFIYSSILGILMDSIKDGFGFTYGFVQEGPSGGLI